MLALFFVIKLTKFLIPLYKVLWKCGNLITVRNRYSTFAKTLFGLCNHSVNVIS